jgi:hypothetical protein
MLRSLFAMGLLIGAVMLLAPLSGAFDHTPSLRERGNQAEPSPAHLKRRDRRPMEAVPTDASLPDPSTDTTAGRSAATATDPDVNQYRPYAGRRAGEGRVRPGREPATPPPGTGNQEAPGEGAGQSSSRRPQLSGRERANPHPQQPHKIREPGESRETEGTGKPGATETPAPSADIPDDDTRAAQEGGYEAVERPGGPTLRVLPIGTGLMLMGLGLGFIGFRLRRR